MNQIARVDIYHSQAGYLAEIEVFPRPTAQAAQSTPNPFVGSGVVITDSASPACEVAVRQAVKDVNATLPRAQQVVVLEKTTVS